MALQTVVPDRIWCTQQSVKYGPLSIKTRATFVRLADGSIWAHSPITPTPELVDSLAQIGPVQYVVAPNTSHRVFFLPFLQAFPEAQGLIAPGLMEKHSDLADFPILGQTDASDWAPDLQSFFVEGLPILNETVWLHASTSTLIVADLLFCFGSENTALCRIAARVLGVYERLGMSRSMKFLVKDKAALARTVDSLLAQPIERVILTHDQIIEQDAKVKLTAAFEWLRT